MHRELFPRTTGEGFDPVNPAAIAADVTIGFMLQPDRAARMVAQNAVDQSLPGLGEVIDRLIRATFDQADVRQLRAGSAARRRARAGRSRDVAGAGLAERAGASDRVAQAGSPRRARSRRRAPRRPSAPRLKANARIACCSPPTSSGSSSGRWWMPPAAGSCRRHRRRPARRSATSRTVAGASAV